jgi:hypothetical protein
MCSVGTSTVQIAVGGCWEGEGLLVNSVMSDWSRETYFDTEKIHIPEDRDHPRFSFRKLWAFTGEENTANM